MFGSGKYCTMANKSDLDQGVQKTVSISSQFPRHLKGALRMGDSGGEISGGRKGIQFKKGREEGQSVSGWRTEWGEASASFGIPLFS